MSPTSLLSSLFILPALLFFLFPNFASANDIFSLINLGVDTLRAVALLAISFAVVFFFFGLVKFITHADDQKAIDEGKSLMVWGIVGMVVLVSFWGIVGYIQESLQLRDGVRGDAPSVQTTVPVR
jgi:hypothetical protein